MTIRTLVVEDDPLVAEINRRYVESVEGFRVVGIATSPEQALAAAASKGPDLIILDIYMPAGSGLDFLAQLRQSGATADVIMATAAGEGEMVGRALRLGVVDYLIKPYTQERFLAALHRYASLRQLVHSRKPVDQGALDRLYVPPAPPATPGRQGMPKGIDPHTLSRVCQALSDARQSITVADLSQATSLSRVTCLRYLAYLVDQGLVSVELAYGAPGRPAKRYRWRPASGSAG